MILLSSSRYLVDLKLFKGVFNSWDNEEKSLIFFKLIILKPAKRKSWEQNARKW